MKLKVVIGSIVWLLAITGAHVQLNVGWDRFASQARILFGMERPELIVGFLPVT